MSKKESNHIQNVKKVKKIANGCWWIEMYLMDRCGLATSWKTVQDRKRESYKMVKQEMNDLMEHIFDAVTRIRNAGTK